MHLILVLAIFLGCIPSGNGNKSKHKQTGLNQTKKFIHSEGNYQQPKRPPTEWEKIFTNDISYKGLISKIYKELIETQHQ